MYTIQELLNVHTLDEFKQHNLVIIHDENTLLMFIKLIREITLVHVLLIDSNDEFCLKYLHEFQRISRMSINVFVVIDINVYHDENFKIRSMCYNVGFPCIFDATGSCEQKYFRAHYIYLSGCLI